MEKEKESFTNRLVSVIIHKRRWIESIFQVLVVVSIICNFFVGTNYDLTEYLPSWAPAKQGINVMEEEFGYPGSARVMISEVSIYEAKAYKDKIGQIDGVDTVSWADTSGQIYVAENFLEIQELDDYYKDGYAIMDIQFEEGDSSMLTYAAIDEIKELLGEKGYFAGPSLDNKTLKETMATEIPGAMVFAVIIILVILAVTTTSWFEPVLFMLTMGIAIILNMGSNLIFGKISFLSSSVASILQLAVAMDYSIFLLHTFTAKKAEGLSVEEAMEEALSIAFSSIISSGATTIIGFLALTLMQFAIGRDMGLVLAKGIICSLVTVLFLMPAFIIRLHKWIDRTQHRPFIPELDRFAEVLFKGRYLVVALVLLTIVPAYTAQSMNDFMYGTAAIGGGEGTKSYEDQQAMNEIFGQNNALMIIVPNSSSVAEKELGNRLDCLPYIKSVASLSSTMPEGIPESFLPAGITEQLHTENYARIIVVIDSETESEEAFAFVEEIKAITAEYYPEDTYYVGTTTATQDMKNIILSDYSTVNLLSILGVAVIIFLSFRSAAMTLVVVIPIEVAININMALPYLYSNKLAFLGYLMVSSMQLGATVDYSILLSNNYLSIRLEEPDKKKAAVQAISKSALSIMTSGTVLTAVGYGLYFISSVTAIADLGRLIGRGALFSTILVLTLLPFLLVFFDRAIFWDQEMISNITGIRKKVPRLSERWRAPKLPHFEKRIKKQKKVKREEER